MASVQRAGETTLSPQTEETAPGNFNVVFYFWKKKNFSKLAIMVGPNRKSWDIPSKNSSLWKRNQPLTCVFLSSKSRRYW